MNQEEMKKRKNIYVCLYYTLYIIIYTYYTIYIYIFFYSTMSAQLNTVSGTIYEDFIVKIMKVNVSESMGSVIMKCTVLVIGFVCVCLVPVIERLGGILQVSCFHNLNSNFKITYLI